MFSKALLQYLFILPPPQMQKTAIDIFTEFPNFLLLHGLILMTESSSSLNLLLFVKKECRRQRLSSPISLKDFPQQSTVGCRSTPRLPPSYLTLTVNTAPSNKFALLAWEGRHTVAVKGGSQQCKLAISTAVHRDACPHPASFSVYLFAYPHAPVCMLCLCCVYMRCVYTRMSVCPPYALFGFRPPFKPSRGSVLLMIFFFGGGLLGYSAFVMISMHGPRPVTPDRTYVKMPCTFAPGVEYLGSKTGMRLSIFMRQKPLDTRYMITDIQDSATRAGEKDPQKGIWIAI